MECNRESLLRKIKALFSLANSNNDNEAQAAILKAQQLMAEYKISQQDITGEQCSECITVEAEAYCEKSQVWYETIAGYIAKHFACGSFYSYRKSSTLCRHKFMGFENDVKIAKICFDNTHAYLKRMYRILKNKGHTPTYLRSYMLGFSEGLSEKLEEQAEAHPEYAIVLGVPKKVEEALNNMGTSRPKTQRVLEDAFAQGVEEGKHFNMHNAIAGRTAPRELSTK